MTMQTTIDNADCIRDAFYETQDRVDRDCESFGFYERPPVFKTAPELADEVGLHVVYIIEALDYLADEGWIVGEIDNKRFGSFTTHWQMVS